MYNRIRVKYIERIKNALKKKPNYEKMYNEERQHAQGWEYKYNKLYRQLNAILKDGE
jgi:hypothetical protein